MKKFPQVRIEPTAEPTFIRIILEKKQYSEPKLYKATEIINGKKVLSVKPGKRWYVWYLWRNPVNDKLDIKIKIYKGINEFKTVKERKAVGAALVKATSLALERGLNPLTKEVDQKKEQDHYLTLGSALDYALKLRSVNKKESTIADYSVRLEFFKDWARKKGYIGLPIVDFDLQKFYQYYDYLLLDYKTAKKKA